MVDADRFQQALKAFLKKNNIKGALACLVNNIVRGLEEDGEATKEQNLVHLLSVASVFRKLNVPALLLPGLEGLVTNLLSNDSAQDALKLTNAPYPPHLAAVVLELKLRIFFHQQNMGEFWRTFEVWKDLNEYSYAETTLILGTIFMNSEEEGSLKKSIEYLRKGIAVAKIQEQLSLLERLNQKLNEAERKEKGEIEATPAPATILPQETISQQEVASAWQQAVETAQSAERELLKEEEARIANAAKKREKQCEGKKIVFKKAVATKEEGDEREKVLQTKDEGGSISLVQEMGNISVVDERRHHIFDIPLFVTMKKVYEDSYTGSTRTNTTEIQKSFIKVPQAQINNCQDLIRLCLRHETLLKVEQSMMNEGICFLVTSEDVCTLSAFFKREISRISPESIESWWDDIKDLFWKVFRAVIRGLMYLFDKDKSCGNLVFNSFVDSEGHGRVLPSMERGKQKEDVLQLVDLMESVIRLALPSQTDLSFLPNHLIRFFQAVRTFNGCCPLEFVIDHPFFWNTSEKISFTFKVRELVKRDPEPLESVLVEYDAYAHWQGRVTRHQHVYSKLFANAKKRKRTSRGYRKCSDIVRFFGAAYTHINEFEYKTARKKRRFSDEQIESDLAGFFPDFYADTFWSLCLCNQQKKITDDDLRGLSSVLSFRGK